MKKILSILLIGVLVIMVGCGDKANVEKKDVEITKMSAEEIINEFKNAGFPVDNIIVCTEENDANELLGRPNQYTSKVNFADTRVEQGEDLTYPVGGTIEVFNNKEDCTARKEYIEAVTKSASILSQYIYQYDNVLLRLDNKLTPTQAEEYENGFSTMKDGNHPKY